MKQAPLSQQATPRKTATTHGCLTPPRLAMLWAASLVFITAGYFQNSRPGWNVNSQFGLTCAIVERGTLSIDGYHARPEISTNDKAFYNGHFYCDKSPVTAFLGVPVFWVYSAVRRGVLGLPMDYHAARYWTTWIIEGGSAALLAAMLVVLLLRRGVTPERAALAAVLWIAATPLMPYSILFFSYLPACAMALGGFLLVDPEYRPYKTHKAHTAHIPVLLGGLLFGLAAWTLNTMALVALVVTAAVVFAPGRSSERLSRLGAWALGGLIGIAGNFIYTRAVFGSWGSPYQYEYDPFFREQMARGLMGATRPRALVAWLITFHPVQGLFLIFPFAAAALAGCVALLRRGGAQRLGGALALAAAAGLILYTSGYFMWWGGLSYVPRHLIPVLVLLPLGLAPWLAARRRWVGRLLLVIGFFGFLLNLPPIAVNPQHPINVYDANGLLVSDPLPFLLRPETVHRFGCPWRELQIVFWRMRYTDRNWGNLLGLQGPVSILPLLAIWAAALWLALRDRAIWRPEAVGGDER